MPVSSSLLHLSKLTQFSGKTIFVKWGCQYNHRNRVKGGLEFFSSKLRCFFVAFECSYKILGRRLFLLNFQRSEWNLCRTTWRWLLLGNFYPRKPPKQDLASKLDSQVNWYHIDKGVPDLSFLIFFSLIWRLYTGRHRRAACLWRRHEPAGRDCFLGHGVWQGATNLHQGGSVSIFTLLFTISLGIPLQRLVGS